MLTAVTALYHAIKAGDAGDAGENGAGNHKT